ncbi:hypothetical protein ABW20_dc0101764 [Dactylellina cionopaga]|nr:hypothetical protein ABW20_dc0101764 [Dactylellina cionopaga]
MSENAILQETATQLRTANKLVSRKRADRPRLTTAPVLNGDEVEFLWGDKAIELDAKEAERNQKQRRQKKPKKPVNLVESDPESDYDSGAYDTAEE